MERNKLREVFPFFIYSEPYSSMTFEGQQVSSPRGKALAGLKCLGSARCALI